jgi:integrase
MGLGGWPDVPLTEARERARTARRSIDAGVDPIEARRVSKTMLRTTPSFAECARLTIAAKAPEWKNPKHKAQWATTLETYANPSIGKLPVDLIKLSHITDVLTPIWTSKTETATRLRARIESVLSWAIASGYRTGENPARWKGNLDAVLAKPGKVSKVEHHRAVSVEDIPLFMTTLRERDGLAARALEFAILTAARSGEVRGARWSEIDIDDAVWTVPADRMKTGKTHAVPLSKPALSVLKKLPKFAGNDFVFPALRGGMLSDMTLSAVMRRMEVDAVPHGFRSTFRDWCAERTAFPREVAEMALAHAIESKVEAAYRRGDLFAKRTKLMAEWGRFLEQPTAKGTVVPLRGARA